jgi:hypothetical protein
MAASQRCPSRSNGRVSAKATNRSLAMPGRWLPCPGKRNATRGASPSGASRSPGRYTPGPSRPARAWSNLARRSSTSSATITSRTGPRPAAEVAAAMSRSRQGRPAGAGSAKRVARSSRARATVSSSPRKAKSSAGHASTDRSGRSPSGCDSTTAWKLVPPNPKALTPATRCSAVQGRASSRNTNGLVPGSQAWLGREMCSVGG